MYNIALAKEDYGLTLTREACNWLLENSIEGELKREITEAIELNLNSDFDFTFPLDVEYRCHPLVIKCIEELGPFATYEQAEIVQIKDKNYDILFKEGGENLIVKSDIEWKDATKFSTIDNEEKSMTKEEVADIIRNFWFYMSTFASDDENEAEEWIMDNVLN